jgi:hypothetical protein
VAATTHRAKSSAVVVTGGSLDPSPRKSQRLSCLAKLRADLLFVDYSGGDKRAHAEDPRARVVALAFGGPQQSLTLGAQANRCLRRPLRRQTLRVVALSHSFMSCSLVDNLISVLHPRLYGYQD